MTLFGDYYFFLVAGGLMLPAIHLGLKEKNIKYYGFAVTVFFIWMAMGKNPTAIVNLVGYVIFQLFLVKSYLKITLSKGRIKWLYWLCILLSLMPLIIWKISSFEHHPLLSFLGLSYVTFKSVQIIIEIYDGLIKEMNSFEFVYFLTFFPCLSSGPIDRSRRFHEDFTRIIPRGEYIEMVGDGLFKIALGMLYKFGLATGFYQAMTWLGNGSDGTMLWQHLVYMYSYGFYLFFDFAGYSLMAIGISYMLGVKSPDNFNKPFISKDMKEFWDRWHMSLSYWFRDFIFSRFMMKSIKGKWFKSKLTGASVGFIVDMAVMGVWHGLDIYYILYGLYHGVLLALTEVYQKKSQYHKKHKKEKWYKFVSWFITFNLAMFGFFIFSGQFTKIIGLTN